MTTTPNPTQDEVAAAIANGSTAAFVSPSIEELAAKPPPRRYCLIPKVPPKAECVRALDAKIGSVGDSLRRVFIAARIWNEKDAEGKLVFTYLFDGHEWPAAVRLAVLASCPLAVHLERRLAAIEHRRAAEHGDPPPPLLAVR